MLAVLVLVSFIKFTIAAESGNLSRADTINISYDYDNIYDENATLEFAQSTTPAIF